MQETLFDAIILFLDFVQKTIRFCCRILFKKNQKAYDNSQNLQKELIRVALRYT